MTNQLLINNGWTQAQLEQIEKRQHDAYMEAMEMCEYAREKRDNPIFTNEDYYSGHRYY